MSISSIVNAAATKVAAATSDPAPVAAATGGGLPYGMGATAAGGVIAQPSNGSLIKKMLVGGVIGAGLGFGASFISLPIVGQVAAPIAAAVGAGIGVLGGLAMHLLSKRKANLAMQAQQNVVPNGQQVVPAPQQAAPTGATLKLGSRGPATRNLQTQLKKLGLLAKVTGTYDRPTVAAVRRYEVMKGVMPTGLGSPDLRAAVAQDVRLIARYA